MEQFYIIHHGFCLYVLLAIEIPLGLGISENGFAKAYSAEVVFKLRPVTVLCNLDTIITISFF